MTDFEKVSGGAMYLPGKLHRIIRYRDKAGVEQLMDIFENTDNSSNSLGRIRDIKGYLDNIGEVISDDEIALENVSGGAGVPYEIGARHFDSIWKRDPRKVIKVFKDKDGALDLQAEVINFDRASIARDIFKSLSKNDKDKMMLASIILSDDGTEVQELLESCLKANKTPW